MIETEEAAESIKIIEKTMIEEFDRLAPTIYGNILKEVPQEPIANNIFEKVMVEELTANPNQDKQMQSPMLNLLNKARKRSKITIDSLNLFRECSNGIEVKKS